MLPSRITSDPDVQWRDATGKALSCAEKRKVLDANLDELALQCRDAFDDALLMGCGEEAFREVLLQMVSTLKPTVRERP